MANSDTHLAARKFRRQVTRSSIFPTLAMIAVIAMLLGLVAYIIATYMRVDHTDQVIAQIARCERTIVDMETGLRGYRLARENDFLKPYDDGRKTIEAEFDALAELTRDNPQQQERIRAMRSQMREWIDYSVRALSVVERGTDITTQSSRTGKAVMDEIRQEAHALHLEEQKLRTERVESARRVTTFSVIVIVAVAVLSGLTFGIIARRSIRRVANIYGGALETAQVRAEETKKALALVDRELAAVADIQRSLLPVELPPITGLTLAANYMTSRQVGGDYYDFFRLPGDEEKWGILIADVSGHGTPAAVLMAVTHSLAHSLNEPPAPPSTMLSFVNHRLCERYTADQGMFVTAFYGIYHAQTRQLQYASAGHPPPRIRRCTDGKFRGLDDAQSLPMGIEAEEHYIDREVTLRPGDTLVLFTDGITETLDRGQTEEFGVQRLDDVIAGIDCDADDDNATAIIRRTFEAIDAYSGNRPAQDDRTMLVARVDGGAVPAADTPADAA